MPLVWGLERIRRTVNVGPRRADETISGEVRTELKSEGDAISMGVVED